MISYVIGDATEPQGDGNKIIAHVCNDLGLWGSGFVVPLGNKYPQAKQSYQQWARGADEWFGLGQIQIVQVADDLYVANMVAQRGVRSENYTKPLLYSYLDECLWSLGGEASKLTATIHMPRIGCGLAGGTWDVVQRLIDDNLLNVAVTVYDLE
jgi:O-acetyl-ADP-ribose deacetylase (regulator of RNase III)